MQQQQLTIDFMDVGQGDGIFIQFPNGKTMLVDMGSTRNKRLAGADAIKFLQTHTKFKDPMQTLDYLILTHPDIDHYNLVNECADTLKMKITNLLYSGQESEYKGKLKQLQDWHKATHNNEAINILRSAGKLPFGLGPNENSQKEFGGVEVLVLAMDVPANSHEAAYTKNTLSIVLQLNYAGHGVILSGDATKDTEAFILNVYQTVGALSLSLLRSTVLKVGHHGSERTSISPQWIAAVRPDFVFICSDRHGALAEDEKNTGHRLPQELAIDIIRKNTKLDTSSVSHKYVSSYDPDDYANYIDPQTKQQGYTDKYSGRSKSWIETVTTEGIFTTLVGMDLQQADASEADQGAQFRVVITSNGVLTITATEDLVSETGVAQKENT